jgi:hypothetical protein
VWVTFHHTPNEGCTNVVPHGSEREALRFLEMLKSDPPLVRFVPFGSELTP